MIGTAKVLLVSPDPEGQRAAGERVVGAGGRGAVAGRVVHGGAAGGAAAARDGDDGAAGVLGDVEDGRAELDDAGHVVVGDGQGRGDWASRW